MSQRPALVVGPCLQKRRPLVGMKHQRPVVLEPNDLISGEQRLPGTITCGIGHPSKTRF